MRNRRGVVNAPWDDNERGVVSLEELLGYAADVFCATADVVGRIVGNSSFAVAGILQNADYMREISHRLSALKKECNDHGWKETVSRIQEVEDYLSGGAALPAVFQSKMADLQSHIFRLLQDEVFFRVDKTKTSEYFEWCRGARWRDSFPYAYLELVSAVECYMFSKPVASVFHSMRALEIALQTLAAKLDVPFEREQWENLINNIEAAIKKINGPQAGTDWKKRQELYSEAALHFRYLKNAWRNHVMHVRHSYDSKAAKTIWVHAGDFVTDLSERVGLKELRP